MTSQSPTELTQLEGSPGAVKDFFKTRFLEENTGQDDDSATQMNFLQPAWAQRRTGATSRSISREKDHALDAKHEDTPSPVSAKAAVVIAGS